MVTRSRKPPPPPPQKEWTLAAVDRGIAKLKRRIADVEALGAEDTTNSDPRVAPLESEIRANIEDVFGTGSRQHTENNHFTLSSTSAYQRAGFNTPDYVIEQQRKARFKEGNRQAIARLGGLVKQLQEIREDFTRCPKCNLTFRLQDYCLNDGTPLVHLDWDPEAPTLRMDEQ